MSLLKPLLRKASSKPAQGGTEHRITIGELSRAYKVSLRTLRFYEDRDLLVPRREGTTRYYAARDKARLEQIIKAKELGFTLTEIRDMLGEPDRPSATVTQVLKPEQIVAQIAHLERQRDDIEGAIAQLRGVQQMSDRDQHG